MRRVRPIRGFIAYVAKQSAGLLVFRRAAPSGLEILAVHPGGPFWAKKDAGSWSIPKGEIDDAGEDELYAVAVREFEEETGQEPPAGEPIELGSIKQSGGKVVHAWGLASEPGQIDAGDIRSNTVEMEWPRGSGRRIVFPEVDKAAWLSPADARTKLISAQVELVDRLLELVEAE